MNRDTVSAVDIRNDFMFSYVMRNPKICIELLEYLLPGCKIDKVDYYKVDSEQSDVGKASQLVLNPQRELLVETQKTLAESFGKRGVRLDAYLDDGKTVYNIEMQTEDQPYLPQRARLYQSHLDINQLKRGQNFDTLRPCFVIFICTFDPFRRGLYRYTFRNMCEEEASLPLNDEAYKLFFNTTGTQGEISDSLREVLRYINNPTVYPVRETDLSLIRSIEAAVSEANSDNEWRNAFMTYEIHQRDAELRGERRGIALGEKRGIALGEKRGIALGEKRGIAIGEARGRTEGKIIGAIEMGRIVGLSDAQIKDSIIQRFNLSAADAAKYLNTPAQS